jgi:hypothetical protein
VRAGGTVNEEDSPCIGRDCRCGAGLPSKVEAQETAQAEEGKEAIMIHPYSSELWTMELEAAGWKKVLSTLWKSPSGALFRGPYHAWELMRSHPELNVPSTQWYDSKGMKISS